MASAPAMSIKRIGLLAGILKTMMLKGSAALQ
jgi:hypothetical protein